MVVDGVMGITPNTAKGYNTLVWSRGILFSRVANKTGPAGRGGLFFPPDFIRESVFVYSNRFLGMSTKLVYGWRTTHDDALLTSSSKATHFHRQ